MNTGEGGCFPLHYDGPGGTKDSRRVTALLYLNPAWRPTDGGALRVLPWMQAPVDVEPLFDRLLLFFSDRMLHRTLPAVKERVCFTVWFHGTGIDPAPETKDGLPAAEQILATMQQVATQRFVSKALYNEEYVRSITEAHRENSVALLDIHRKDVVLIEETPGLGAVVAFLKDFIKDKQRPVTYATLHERAEEDRLLLAMMSRREAMEAALREEEEKERERERQRTEDARLKRERDVKAAGVAGVARAEAERQEEARRTEQREKEAAAAAAKKAAADDEDVVAGAPDAVEGQDDWMNML